MSKKKHTKKLNAKRHLGKVKWNEDPLEYQKRVRNEWDSHNIRYSSADLI